MLRIEKCQRGFALDEGVALSWLLQAVPAQLLTPPEGAYLGLTDEKGMDRNEMLSLFEAHREAEAARDIDAILETFVPDCFLETMPTVGTRCERPYESQFFTAFPDLVPRASIEVRLRGAP